MITMLKRGILNVLSTPLPNFLSHATESLKLLALNSLKVSVGAPPPVCTPCDVVLVSAACWQVELPVQFTPHPEVGRP